MDVQRILNNEKQLTSLTGLTFDMLEEILPEFKLELQKMGHLNSQKIGRPSKLGINGVILLLMMHIRHYMPFDAIGALFDLDDSNAKRWIDDSVKALKSILEKKNLHHLIAPKKERKLTFF